MILVTLFGDGFRPGAAGGREGFWVLGLTGKNSVCCVRMLTFLFLFFLRVFLGGGKGGRDPV